MRAQLVDQRAVDLRPEAVDRGLAPRRDAVDGARLLDDGARDGEVALRRQEARASAAQSAAGRPAPPSAHRHPSSTRRPRRDDRTTVTQAICCAVGNGARDQAGRQPAHADLVAAVADADAHPGTGREQIVERRRPGRDIDAAHVARLAVGAAAAAFDGDGVLTPAPRHASVRRSMPARSSTPTSSTATPPPAAATAARTARGTGRVDGDPRRHAARRQCRSQQGRADRAIGLGRRDIAARHEKAGDQADGRCARQALARSRASSPRARVDQRLRLASDIAADHAPRWRDRRRSLLLGDIHSRPISRRIVDQAVDPLAHHLVIALLPAHAPAAAWRSRRSSPAPRRSRPCGSASERPPAGRTSS